MRDKFVAYFVSHFRGEQSVAWSFFVNGALFYFAFVGAVGLAVYQHPVPNIAINVVVTLFVVWFVWSLIGNVRAAVKTILGVDHRTMAKLFAVFVIVVLVVVAFYSDVVKFLYPEPTP